MNVFPQVVVFASSNAMLLVSATLLLPLLVSVLTPLNILPPTLKSPLAPVLVIFVVPLNVQPFKKMPGLADVVFPLNDEDDGTTEPPVLWPKLDFSKESK